MADSETASLLEMQEQPEEIRGSQNGKEPRISHAVLLTVAQLSRGMVRLVFVVATARVLGPELFGTYALLLAAVEMIAVASGTGCMDYLTREAARDESLGWGLAGQLVGLRLVCTLLFVGAGLGLLWSLGYARFVLVSAAWFSLTLIWRSLSEAIQGVLRGTGHYLGFFLIELAFGLPIIAGASFLLMRGGGLQVVIATELVAATAAALATVFLALKFRPAKQIRVSWSRLLKTSSIFNLYAFVGGLYDRLDVVLLSKLAGDYATGIYSAAYRPLGTIQLVPYGILYSLLPTLSRDDQKQIDRERLERAMGLLLSVAFIIVLATTVFSEPAIGLLFGARYAQSVVALKILIWAVILRFINYAFNVRLLAAGYERVFVATSLACLAVNILGNLILIPLFSWRAASVMTLVTEVVLFMQNLYWLRRAVGEIPKPFAWMRTTLVFAVVLAVALLGGRIITPITAGSVCLLLFATYLYRTGMFSEFAAAWGARNSEEVCKP